MAKPNQKDDPSSAPESGTVRGPTSGNKPADPANRPAARSPEDAPERPGGQQKDDPSTAPEEG